MAMNFEITITVVDRASAVLDRVQRHLDRMASLDAQALLADLTEPATQDEEGNPAMTADPFAPIPRDTAEWVDITDPGLAVGYPVHRPIAYRRWVSNHRLDFVDWRGFCGAIGTTNGGALHGPLSAFGQVTTARKGELCPTCYPGRDWRQPAR